MKFELDLKHESFNLFNDPIVREVWQQRYQQPGEDVIQHTFSRVAAAVYKGDNSTKQMEAYTAMCLGLWMPGGRILNGQGTWMNCYVSRNMDDSIQGIFRTLEESMSTLSQFGGIGINFGFLRPKGAEIARHGLTAPGPLPFMDLFHEAADKIMQAGHRRGAMMGVMPDWHPDLLDFITAKQTKGRLTNFNVSVLISDAFMDAVKSDGDWVLYHTSRPAGVRSADLIIHDYNNKQGKVEYAYAVHKARSLWEQIARNTYEYSEPGVIFIDRINKLNNLAYCETVFCTNPCGEQPLPPNGTCNLGAGNLARMVRNPFTTQAYFDYNLLRDVVHTGVRFLDNVIDRTEYPLEEQRHEEFAKRRLGLGVSGLADAIAQMGKLYGSREAQALTSKIMTHIANEAYAASANLAIERGSFPLYDKEQILQRPFIRNILHPSVRNDIERQGLRNGVLLTIAPTGTTSIVFGNISSGIEPVFAHRTKRTVYGEGNIKHEYESVGFGARFYKHCLPTSDDIPFYMSDSIAERVSVQEHLEMQGTCQRYVDASVSKTINMPANFGFGEFQRVYEIAYDLGCKGCTTYRPNMEVRGAVLEHVEEKRAPEVYPGEIYVDLDDKRAVEVISETADEVKITFNRQTKRPKELIGCTYKIIWPSLQSGVFLTVNEHEGQPWEIFIQSKDLRNVEWITLVAVMLSRSLQHGDDPMLLADQFKQIQGAHDGQWIEGKYYSSLPAYIGELLEQHFRRYIGTDEGTLAAVGVVVSPAPTLAEEIVFINNAPKCPQCFAPMMKSEGCYKCTSCTYSNCG